MVLDYLRNLNQKEGVRKKEVGKKRKQEIGKQETKKPEGEKMKKQFSQEQVMDALERLQVIGRIVMRYVSDGFGYEDYSADFRKFKPELYEQEMQKYGDTKELNDALLGWEDILFKESLAELLDYMKHNESRVRLEAMRVFNRVQKEVSHVDIESEHIRQSERLAYHVKVDLNNDKYWKVAVKAMGDENPEIRELAKSAVKEFSWRVALPDLYKLLKNDNPHIRRGAREALAEIFWNAYGEECFPFREFLKYLIEAAGQENDDIRYKIDSEFHDLGDPYFTDVFVERLRNSPTEGAREYAAETLAWQVLSGEAENALIEALEDPSPRVRRAAAKTIGEIEIQYRQHHPKNWPSPEENHFTYPLIKALDDKDAGVREAALEALGKIGVEKITTRDNQKM